MGVSSLKGFRLSVVKGGTPGSEIRVPLVTWPRTRVPPVERLPLPIWN